MHALAPRRSIFWAPPPKPAKEAEPAAAPRSRWPFAGALVATFADYLGLAMVTPALPFYLAELGLPTAEIPIWNGAITSAQYVTIIAGNTVWGRVSDVHGSQRALQLAMAGDTLFFALSAVAPFGLHRTWSPVAGCAILVGVRACVGFFTPLVSAVLFIFDRAASPKDIVKGLSYYSNAIIGAYSAGGVLVGVAYPVLKWSGVNALAAGLAAAAFLYISFLGSPPLLRGKKPKPEGLSRALRTKAFATHACTAFLCGWTMNSLLLTVVLLLKEAFSFSSHAVGYVFLLVPVLMLPLSLMLPRVTTRYGLQWVISCAGLWNVACLAVATVPAVHGGHPAILILAFASILFGLVAQQIPNQARGKHIAERYAKNATGAVTATARNFFALGQAISPIVSGSLFRWHRGAPFALNLVVQLCQLGLYLVTGTPLFSDPPPVPSAAAVAAVEGGTVEGGTVEGGTSELSTTTSSTAGEASQTSSPSARRVAPA